MGTQLRSVATIAIAIIVLATSFLADGLRPVRAATFEVIAPGIISIQGPIELGDCDRWKEASERELTTVLLNSPGGRVGQGECISRSIAQKRLRTVVLQRCASICFLMFAAGSERLVCEQARIGVHRPSDVATKQESGNPEILQGMMHYAADYGVPDAIRIKMSTTPAREIYWLSYEDLGLMNVVPCR